MGKASLMTKKKYLKKHVSAVRISARIGLLARKSWNILLLNAYDELLSSRTHTIKISDLCNLTGCNTRNLKRVRSALDQLQNSKVKWNVGGDDIHNLNVGSVPLLGGYRIENGTIEYDYSAILSKMLHNPDIYAKINYLYQDAFDTSYELALWENCLRFVSVGTTGLSPVQEWRELLGATAKSYDTYTVFSKMVLKPSILGVNKKSNIEIELMTKKSGKFVVEMGFAVKSKDQILSLDKSLDLLKETSEYKELIENGLSKIQALKFMQEHKKCYVREKIDLVLEMKKKGEIKKTVSGALISAINDDWKNDLLVKQQQQNEQKQIEFKLAKKKKAEDKQKQLRTQCIRAVIADYVEGLSASERKALESKMAKEHPHITRKGVADLYSPILWKPMQQEITNFDELLEAKISA